MHASLCIDHISLFVTILLLFSYSYHLILLSYHLLLLLSYLLLLLLLDFSDGASDGSLDDVRQHHGIIKSSKSDDHEYLTLYEAHLSRLDEVGNPNQGTLLYLGLPVSLKGEATHVLSKTSRARSACKRGIFGQGSETC